MYPSITFIRTTGSPDRAQHHAESSAASTNETVATEKPPVSGVEQNQSSASSFVAFGGRRPLWARMGNPAPNVTALPGQVATSPLVRHPRAQTTLTERQLFGVARWPVVCDPKESEVFNQAYGLAFSKEALRLGRRIGQQKYQLFTHVWADCRQWRENYENKFGGKDENFGKSRIGTIAVYSTPIVSGQRYAYMAPRIGAMPNASRRLIIVPKQINGQAVTGTMKVLEASYTATTTISGEPKSLTQVKAWFEPDGSPLRTPPAVPVKIGDMVHTTVGMNFIPLVREANDLFHEAIKPGLSPAERLGVMGDLHWILVHAMPDRRGSAAKAELAVRAIGYSVGIELPPFAPGIVPDLEAFLLSREEFVDRYANLFSRPPLLANAP
jgi:avirulence protein